MNKGLSKGVNFLKKLIINLIISWFKVLDLFGRKSYTRILTCSLVPNCVEKGNLS